MQQRRARGSNSQRAPRTRDLLPISLLPSQARRKSMHDSGSTPPALPKPAPRRTPPPVPSHPTPQAHAPERSRYLPALRPSQCTLLLTPLVTLGSATPTGLRFPLDPAGTRVLFFSSAAQKGRGSHEQVGVFMWDACSGGGKGRWQVGIPRGLPYSYISISNPAQVSYLISLRKILLVGYCWLGLRSISVVPFHDRVTSASFISGNTCTKR